MTLLSKISSACATDLSDSCFLLVVQMLLPMGKIMFCWLNSYPAVLTAHHFLFLWLGCWQVLDDFQCIPGKYWCFAQMTPSKFNKLPIRFSVKVVSLKNVSGILLVCKFKDLMWSSTDNLNLSLNTNQQLVALVLWMLHNFFLIWYSNYHNYMHLFFIICYKSKKKSHEDKWTIISTMII